MTDKKQEIWGKIAAVQQEIGALTKSKENPFFKSSYFDINDIIENLLPLLEKHKLVVIQPLTHVEGRPAIKTKVVSLDTDEWVEDTTVLPDVSKAQDMGSAVTYFRRYSLQSFFLLQAQDDDGNTASNRSSGGKTKSGFPKKPPFGDDED